MPAESPTPPDALPSRAQVVINADSWIGSVRAAAYGHTLGGALGLAGIEYAGGATRIAPSRANLPYRLPLLCFSWL